MGRIIGIDLGTTNSCVAVMEGGEPVVISQFRRSAYDSLHVGFTPKGERVVGQPAKNQMITNPENTVYSIKRFMGRRYQEVGDETKLVPYHVVDNGSDVRVDIRGKGYSPQEVSAFILQKMKKTAEDYLGETVTRGRHHGTGVFQRRAAPGYQGCRQDRRPRGQAHHQRADGRLPRLRLRQGPEEGRDHRRVRSRRRHLRRIHPRAGRGRLRGEVHQRRHPPGRGRFRPAHHASGSLTSSRRTRVSTSRRTAWRSSASRRRRRRPRSSSPTSSRPSQPAVHHGRRVRPQAPPEDAVRARLSSG